MRKGVSGNMGLSRGAAMHMVRQTHMNQYTKDS